MADPGGGGGGGNGGGGGGRKSGGGGGGGDNDEKLAQFIAVTGVASEDIANHWLEVTVFWSCRGIRREGGGNCVAAEEQAADGGRALT